MCEVGSTAGLASSQTGIFNAQFPLACLNARAQAPPELTPELSVPPVSLGVVSRPVRRIVLME